MEKIHLQCHLTFRSHGQVRNVNSYICISTTPIATKLCKVVIYCQKTTPTKSCDVLIKWSRDKCKALYLFFRNTCSHQTQQSSNLSWRELNFKAMWPFLCGVTWYMKKTGICTSTIPITIKLGRVVTYSEKTPPTNLRDLSITWSRGKCKLLYLDVGNTYDLQTCQSGNLQWRNPKFKVTWTFDHVTRDKWKNLYRHLHYIYDHQTWQSGNLRLEAPSIRSRDLLMTQAHGKWKKRLTLAWIFQNNVWPSGHVYGHYLPDVFKISVAILLIVLSLLSVVLSRWESNFHTILFKFSELLALEITKSNDVQICQFILMK